MYMCNNACAAHCNIVQVTEAQVAGTANPVETSEIGKGTPAGTEIEKRTGAADEVAGTAPSAETSNIGRGAATAEVARTVTLKQKPAVVEVD